MWNDLSFSMTINFNYFNFFKVKCLCILQVIIKRLPRRLQNMVGKVYLMTTLISNSVRMKETNFYLLTKIIASGLPYFDLSVDSFCRIYGCEVLMFWRHIKQHDVQYCKTFSSLFLSFKTIKFFHQVHFVRWKNEKIHEIWSLTGAPTLLHEKISQHILFFMRHI